VTLDSAVALGSGWAWLALAGLGAFHGLNPAMGWLFAVSLGIQEQRRSAVFKAIPAIAVGHALSVGLGIAAVAGAQLVIPVAAIRWGGGAALVGFGVYRLWRRGQHSRWLGKRVGTRDLVLWSFLMATAHGAGLMVVPVLLHLPAGAHEGHMASLGASPENLSLWAAGAALGVHTLALFAVMTAAAVLAYETVGLELLRRNRINLDLIWSVALVGAGLATVLLAG
jgi:hypothetical protein